MADTDQFVIRKILELNKHKSFVQRILDPKNSPSLDNKDGTRSSHSMAWAESDGRYFVYPTVLRTESGELKRFKDNEAWRETQKSGNYIEFKSAQDADWFSKNYKRVWDK